MMVSVISMKVSMTMSMSGNGLPNETTMTILQSPDYWFGFSRSLSMVVSVSMVVSKVSVVSKRMNSSGAIAKLSNKPTVTILESPDCWFGIGGSLSVVVSVSMVVFIEVSVSVSGNSAISKVSNKSTGTVGKSPDCWFGISGSLTNSGTGSGNIRGCTTRVSGNSGLMDSGYMGSMVVSMMAMAVVSMVTIAPRLSRSLAQGVSRYSGGSTTGMFHGEGGVESGGCRMFMVQSMMSVVSVVTIEVSMGISGSLTKVGSRLERVTTSGMVLG